MTVHALNHLSMITTNSSRSLLLCCFMLSYLIYHTEYHTSKYRSSSSSSLIIITLIYHALPALPICKISPVVGSSLLSTGQLAPSALTNFNSSFEPRILYVDSSVSMAP